VVDELKKNLRERLAKRLAPFNAVDVDVAAATIDRLTDSDGDSWGALWREAAVPFSELGAARENAGDTDGAQKAYFKAYALAHVGRYPTPNSPQKLAAYRFSIDNYRRAGRYFAPPIEVHEVPFQGRAGEGSSVIFYVRRPSSRLRKPVVLRWA
jgi:esterase FrsA